MKAAFRLPKVQSPLVIAAVLGALVLLGSVLTYIASLPRLELRASSIAPIIDIPSRGKEPRFFFEFLRDPDLAGRRPQDDRDATRLGVEIKEFRSDLSRARGERALELHEQAYQGYAALAYYLDDIVKGNLAGDKSLAQQNLASIREFLLQHAQSVAKLSRSPEQRSRALYHALTTQFQLGRERGRSLQGLRALTEERSKLSTALSSRALLLVNIESLETAKQRRDVGREMAQLAGSLDGYGAFVARIGAARAYAGLNRNGQKLTATDAAYRAQLAAAAQISREFGVSQKEEALLQVISVWRQAEGASADWAKIPFQLGPFADTTLAKAIIERHALADWYKGNLPSAIRKYEAIAKSLNGQHLRGTIDLRVLDLHRAQYARRKNAKEYQKALLAKQKAYLDPGLLGTGNEGKAKMILGEVERRHAGLALSEMGQAIQARSHPSQRENATRLTNKFLSSVEFRPEFEPVKEKLAQTYMINKQPKRAVTVYRELAETGSNAKRHYALAISAQSQVAQWPVELPWRGESAGAAVEREELLTLYSKYIEVSGGQKNAGWFVLAHQGLLLNSLNRREEAFAMWQAHLAQDSRGPIAAQVAGMMLTTQKKALAWDDVEGLARLCLKAKIAPSFNGQMMSPTELLGLALLEGGVNALNANQFELAVKKLVEFVAAHGSHARHDEGMFGLAHAYRGANQHKESITTLMAMVERHPGSKLQRLALLRGGDWSIPMAYEENAMFFYAAFLKRFSQDAEANRVRLAVTDLYLGRGLYQQATEALLALVSSPQMSPSDKSMAMSQLLDIEVRYGSMQRATKLADQMIASKSIDHEHKAQAFGVKTDLVKKEDNIAGLRTVLAQLKTLEASPAVTEVMAKTQHLLAEAASRGLIQEFDNLALKNPVQTLSERFAHWQRVKAAYDAVCEVGVSSFCPVAMHDLARLAIQFSRSLEDITIQETLAKAVVQKFNSQKQYIFNEVARSAQKSDAVAYAAVERGESSPDTTQAVIWQNSSDWNFDRVSGEAGNAYVQWAPAEFAGEK